ncbi:hypothetical protein P879_03469 [Paragonimus westermani]|uniref:Uncharacterized protein n=1 Tax=Paragonimus westermani TaxID=34504 RepID=A0A8T0DAQ1_9TREM|nr:hypothetical protein P879_03469 [Paragonimus westermani]
MLSCVWFHVTKYVHVIANWDITHHGCFVLSYLIALLFQKSNDFHILFWISRLAKTFRAKQPGVSMLLNLSKYIYPCHFRLLSLILMSEQLSLECFVNRKK